jgi:hypothetical protein
VRREQRVRFHLFQRQANALLAEGTSYLFEREELLVRVVLYKVYV